MTNWLFFKGVYLQQHINYVSNNYAIHAISTINAALKQLSMPVLKRNRAIIPT
jgi:hypothetical protein